MASQEKPVASQGSPLAAFGANEWLVEEMYERYRQDPDSVDKEWLAFFRDLGDRPPTESANATPTASAAATSSAPAKPAAPTTKRQEPATRPAEPATKPAEPATKQPEPAPKQPAARPVPKDQPVRSQRPAATGEAEQVRLRGAAARTALNMNASLEVPTATSVRSVPVKLLIDNRIVINSHLRRARGGKVSFTHIIGFALVQALKSMPEMNVGYDEVDGKPTLLKPGHINLGLAIDLQKSDGSRQLVVPSIKAAESMDFAAFWGAYEDIIRRARAGELTVEDFQGTTVTLTNPGTIGTNHSVPRLMKGQGCIIGVGSMEYPPEFQGASEHTIADLAISKMMTLTSTYDHRVIQGAQSGEFLRRVHILLLGEDDFYDSIFRSLRIPYEPIRWSQDISTSHDDDINKQARVLELIHAYRVRGHIMADT
ncbi:MAG: 2-oxo acid dehydrogenase subunit E2, partial [Nocardioidaceae bacterium]